MLRRCVLTVFSETDSFAGDLGPGQVGRQISQHPELAGAELSRRRQRGLVFRRQG